MAKNLKPVESRLCPVCDFYFTPKDGGYNAKYCSKSCKQSIRAVRDREIRPDVLSARRKRSYERTKAKSSRYAAHKESIKKSRSLVRQWLADFKMERGCVDCGYKGHFSALQLDHEGVKSVSIAHARSSISRLKEEIEKGQCVVRCANCHSIKTWERKQNAEA